MTVVLGSERLHDALIRYTLQSRPTTITMGKRPNEFCKNLPALSWRVGRRLRLAKDARADAGRGAPVADADLHRPRRARASGAPGSRSRSPHPGHPEGDRV